MSRPTSVVRPLRYVSPGVWASPDDRWRFCRHDSDPKPQRWFAYLDERERPENDGWGHVRLADAADWAAKQALPDLEPTPDPGPA